MSQAPSTGVETALLALGLSSMGILIAVIVAGASDSAGSLTVIFLAGLWLVWLVRHAGAFSSVSRLFGSNA